MSTVAMCTSTGHWPTLKLYSMRALICSTPGLLEYRDIPEPSPVPGRSILRIRRVGVCGTDLHAYRGTQPYFTYPRILGHELSGDVVDGAFSSAGHPFTILPYFSCGTCIACRSGKPNCCASLQVCGVHVDGGMVDYLSVPDQNLVFGDGLSYEALALVEPLAIGAHAVRRATVREGEIVLVMGAGPIGLGTMAFARAAGATVIALDTNEKRLRFCRENLGIRHAILSGNLAKETVRDLTHGDMASVVIDATGSLQAINSGLDYLAHGGRYVLVGLQKEAFSFSHPEFHKRESTLMSSRNATRSDFEHVMTAMRQGAVDPVTFITNRVSFPESGNAFGEWLLPGSGVIKAMIEL